MVEACPADFHPAFMHGDKRSQIPGIHPPSYEDALRDPTEPPTYALPPPLPSQPPPMTSSNEIYDIGGSQIYDVGGEYPTLPKYSTLPRDESKPTPKPAENESSLYDNHAFGSSSLYDQAGKSKLKILCKIRENFKFQQFFRTTTITAAFTSAKQKFQSAST